MFNKYNAYKDSGFQWIGEVPTNWFIDRLGTILEPVSKKGNADKPLLSITREKGVILRDVEDDSENHNFIPDDLSNYKLIEKGQFGMNKMKAWQGSYGVSSHTGIVSPAYYVFRFIKPIYPEFFHWAIRSKTYISFFGSASDGVRIGQWDLSKDRMKNIPFVFPDVDSQKKIVEFIQDKAEQIDQAIAIKEQQIALLNERKQIVIQKAVTQGLNPNVAMKDSGVEWIGKIPEHWDIDRLGTILEPISKKGHADKPLLSITREKGVIVRDVEDDSENHNFIPDDLTNYKLIEVGQFGMNKMKAWQGSYGVSSHTGIVSPAYYVFRFIKPIYPEFFHWAIRCKLYVSFFGSASDGVRIGQWDLSKDRMKHIPFVFPSLEQQKTIAHYLTQQTELISEGIKQYSAQIEKLKEYKTTLINDAVTGKIKVA